MPEKTIRSVIDQMSEGIQIIDNDWRYLYVNAAAAKHGRTTEDYLLGRTMMECYPGIDKAPFWRDLLYVRETGVPRRIENEFEFENGLKSWFELHIEAHTHGVLIRSLDITDRKKIEEQLRHSQRAETINHLAAGIAHDFNNKLGIILAYAEMARDSLETSTVEARDCLESITGAARQSAGLVKKLMGLSRKQILDVQVVSVKPFLERVCSGLRTLLGSAIEVKLQVEHDPLRVKVDAIECEQMILNLCVNARDAMPAGGKIVIRVARVELDETYARDHANVTPGTFVLFEISDSGQGMDRATVERIFEPFFTTKAPGRGTGLGMAIVQGFVQQCNGHIWVYSEPGMGTSVKIYIPATDQTPPLAETRAPLTSSNLRGSETLLIVEDDLAMREAFVKTLAMAGYRVLAAAEEEAADAILGTNPAVKLLITDVVLGRGSGIDLANRTQANFPGLKVMYMTGGAHLSPLLSNPGEEGVILRKPIMTGDLLRTVRGVLDGEIKKAVV